ncbi:MAG: sugar-binding protein, partial [Opitutaceae bacterium]
MERGLTGAVSETVVGTPNNTVTFGALWNSTHLYVAAKVLDSQLFNDTANTGTPPTNVWQDDSVEVYIDGNHSHATSYELTGGANGLGNDRQFTKGYNESALSGKGSQTGVAHAWGAITGGYTVEIAIPWSNVNVSGAAAGLTIGFDAANNDDDNGGATRESHVVWAGTGTNYNNTSAFGDLTLSASIVGDAAPEVNVTALFFCHRGHGGEPERTEEWHCSVNSDWTSVPLSLKVMFSRVHFSCWDTE